MKYICLGYIDEQIWNTMPESEINKFIAEATIYYNELKQNGYMVGGEALQSSRNATTLRGHNNAVDITDGPYAETKEQIGGIMFLEARDLNHAIQLMSNHPSVRLPSNTWEIRPIGVVPTIPSTEEKIKCAALLP